MTGTVLLAAEIGLDGRIESLSVLTPEMSPTLVRPAVEAARLWLYNPIIRNGVPVKGSSIITTTFSMTDK